MNDDKYRISNLVVFGLFVLVVLSWIASLVYVPKIYGKPEGAGTFGDMFGAINALYSGLAFAGVIVAILLQKNELSLQREELEQTREELRGQKEQLELQNETIRNQNYETTFFNLLNLYQDIVKSMDISVDKDQTIKEQGHSIKKTSPVTVIGRDVFSEIYDLIWRRCESNLSVAKIQARLNSGAEVDKGNFDLQNCIDDTFMWTYDEFKSDLSHYFLTLYNILKFIDKSGLENKKFYSDILRAQLSSGSSSS